jgi:hypothetical protein
MGMIEGILKGVSQAFQETTARMTEENQRQAMLESRVYEALLGSPHADVQELALQGMSEVASGKGGKRKGLMGFLGKQEPSPALAGMGALFKGGEKPAGGPSGGPPSGAMPSESPVEPGAQGPRRIFPTQAQVAGEVTGAQLETRADVLRKLMEEDPETAMMMMGRQPPGPEVLRPGEQMYSPAGELIAGVPPEYAPPEREFRTVAPGGTVIDPNTGDVVFRAPPRPEKPGEDERFTRAKRTQKALQSYQQSGGLALTGMKRPQLDEFVQQYGDFADYDDYLNALAGGTGTFPPSAGFDINQIPEQYRRFVDPTSGQPSPEADQRMQIIIEKLRTYKADPDNNPPLDEHEVEFANVYQMLFLGGSSGPP